MNDYLWDRIRGLGVKQFSKSRHSMESKCKGSMELFLDLENGRIAVKRNAKTKTSAL